MERKIYKENIPSIDSRLNRHINHDPKSKEFALDTSGLQVISVKHERLIPILNQGNLGSCTGNAGVGDINTSPFIQTPNPFYTPDESGAVKLYSDAEKIDGGAGYPPEDNGSSGLSIAKALKNAGMISGYQHVFTLNDTLKALSKYPVITGTYWYEGMFNPDPDGRVHPTGALAGGHEYEAVEVDKDNGLIWFCNSWGESWGVKGRFYMTWFDYANLLARNGDATILFPSAVTPPTPIPAPKTNKVVITRGTDNGTEVIGALVATHSSGNTFTCNTLELSWKNNAVTISSIPKGIYTCSVKSFHGKPRYELNLVPGRAGIFIHEGNYYKNTHGCILVGVLPSDINKDGQIDVTNSLATVAKLMEVMKNEPFTLQIT